MRRCGCCPAAAGPADRVPHRHLAGLVASDITVAAGVATVTVGDQTRTVVAVDDPVLCAVCYRPLAACPPGDR